MAKKALPVEDIADAKWHWDKRVPIALIVSFFLTVGTQTGVAIWYASKLDARVENLEVRVSTSTPQVTSQNERLIRVEEKVVSIQSGITEIKDLLRPSSKDIRLR